MIKLRGKSHSTIMQSFIFCRLSTTPANCHNQLIMFVLFPLMLVITSRVCVCVYGRKRGEEREEIYMSFGLRWAL